jgi:hypothetical protein
VSHVYVGFLSIVAKIRNYQRTLVHFSILNFMKTTKSSIVLQSGRQTGMAKRCWPHFLNLAMTPSYKLRSQHAIRTSPYDKKLSLAPVVQMHTCAFR